MSEKSVCLWVISDGVENSVFESQVLRTIGRHLDSKRFGKVVVLAFQADISRAHQYLSELEVPDGVEFVFCKRLPFFGTISLENCVEAASNQIFKIFPDVIYARGPISGYICIKALEAFKDDSYLRENKDRLPKLIIQSRGLLTKEYEYVNRFSSWNPFLFPVRWFIAKRLEYLEKVSYSENSVGRLPYQVTIEAVTPALGDYLVEEFGASRSRISFAMDDFPTPLSKDEVKKNRDASRLALGLTPLSKVYCYAGSAKAWQCPEKTVKWFAEKLKENSDAYLLVISRDKDFFESLIEKVGIPPANYTVVTICNQKDFYKALCAADVGLLFREDHPINWVARPVKAMDYMACGLSIEHNSTVRWVIENADVGLPTRSGVESTKIITAAQKAPSVRLKKKAKKVKSVSTRSSGKFEESEDSTKSKGTISTRSGKTRMFVKKSTSKRSTSSASTDKRLRRTPSTKVKSAKRGKSSAVKGKASTRVKSVRVKDQSQLS